MAPAEYDALVAVAPRALIGLDFDGTLSPIVADPTQARIHPAAPAVLADLARVVGTVAIITGRPVAQVLSLGSLESVDGDLIVLGQYGNERWDSRAGEILSAPPPAGLADLRASLDGLLERAGVPDAFVEDKGLALAVHTRRCADPQAAFDALVPVLTEAAGRHGLAVEPGRLVVELRAPGMDKGKALQSLVDEIDPAAVAFVGDDLGDLAAFELVRTLEVPGFLVCSGSDEQQALVDLADLVVPGPDGVMDFLRGLTGDA